MSINHLVPCPACDAPAGAPCVYHALGKTWPSRMTHRIRAILAKGELEITQETIQQRVARRKREALRLFVLVGVYAVLNGALAGFIISLVTLALKEALG